jgi:hypothetical protein
LERDGAADVEGLRSRGSSQIHAAFEIAAGLSQNRDAHSNPGH